MPFNPPAALIDISDMASMFVESGLNGGPGWTPEQYATAVLAILDSPYHVVQRSQLNAKLGGGSGGAAAVTAMVRANLLALRPPSRLAVDIPQVAYGDNRKVVVTAPTPARLHAMKRLRADFENMESFTA